MREEQQKDRDRVTRRGGTKMFGSAAAPKSAERIRAFDEDKEYGKRGATRGQRRAEDVRDDRRSREDDRRYREDDRRYREDDRRYREDDRRYREDDRRYREDDRRYREDDRRYREDDRDYREDDRDYRDADERAYRDSRRYREEDGRDAYRRARGESEAGRRTGTRREDSDRGARRTADKPRDAKNKKKPAASTANTDLFAHQVVPYVMFWLALFAAVSFILRDLAGLSASAGAFGNWLADFLCGILGIGAYLLPLFLIVLSLRWKRFVREGILGKKLFLSTTFLLLLSGIIHVFQDVDRARKMTAAALLFAEGKARSGGGLFGGFVGEWLGFFLRLPGTCLLAIPLLIIIGIYLVGMTPSGLWQRVDAKLKMIRQRRREERGANGAKIAAPEAKGQLGAGEEKEAPAWKEPRALSRSATPMYDFREDEPDVEIDRPGEKAKNDPQAKEMPRSAARHSAADLAYARRTAEVNEILDIPDDEPEIIEPSPEARTILSQAGQGEDAKWQVEDILRNVEHIAAAPEAPTDAPKVQEEGNYYAPFALPVRPEPRRDRTTEPERSHIVITPHASDEVAASATPPAADTADLNSAAEIEGEECLGNRQPNTYGAARFMEDSREEQPFADALRPQAAVTTKIKEQATVLPPREQAFVADDDVENMGQEEMASEAAVPTATSLLEEDVSEFTASWQTPREPQKVSFAERVFEEDEGEVTESFELEEPSHANFGFEDEEQNDSSMPASGVAAVRERVAPEEKPAFAPSASFTAPTPTRYEPPRPVSAVRVEPIREEAPPPPAPVRKEYVKPPLTLLNEDKNLRNDDFYEEIEETKQILRSTLESFNIHIQDEVAYSHGPSVTRYELRPVAGTSVRSVTNRIEDISLNLASMVRIEAPIPGKPAIGIEVPNKVRETVYMRTMLESEEFKNSTDPLEVPLGLDVGGEVKMCNLAKMPHLLVAGTTGSGKSVCINSILVSLIYKTSPEDLRLILIDPKQIEFAPYEHVPHLYMPIVTDMQRAAGALACAVQEMERRFSLIKDVGVRNIEAYNEAVKNDPDREHLPYMVIVIDEFADLKMSCSNNDPENFTCRIAQKARAAGIHLIIGTQRPSVDVITGKLKTNIPSRIAFMVKQQVDSRTILDANGAESLTGRGDMLYMPSNSSDKAPNRVQGAFVSDGELERVISYVRKNNDPVQYNQAFMDQIEIEMAKSQNSGKKNDVDDFVDDGEGSEDPKFFEAVKLAVETQKVATSLLQRRLGVGYGRAAKIIDRMEELGLVSAPDGNKPRQILPAAQGYLNHMAAEDEGGSDEFNDYQ